MMTEECKVQCRVERGAYDEEMVVTVPTVDSSGVDSQATCLAYGESVELQGDFDESGQCDGALRVHCLGERESIAAIVLPQSTLQNGPSVLVRKEHLL